MLAPQLLALIRSYRLIDDPTASTTTYNVPNIVCKLF